jgi:drug/metabolite transporter (DMT)-like permease
VGILSLSGGLGMSAGDLLTVASGIPCAMNIVISAMVSKNRNTLLLTAIELWVVAILAWIFVFAGSGLPEEFPLGAVGGIVFLVAFVLLQWNTARNGIVLSSVFMKLGLLVPMILSVLFFHEIPTGLQIIGFCLALLAIVLINAKKEKDGSRFRWELLLLLLMGGGADAMSKVFEALGPAALSDQFLFYVFAVALILCAALVVYQKEHPGIWELLFGAAIGIPNFFSSKFLLRSLADLPAVVVYPSFSVATMLITTLVGVAFFKERLQKLQWLALIAILAALFLLNI